MSCREKQLAPWPWSLGQHIQGLRARPGARVAVPWSPFCTVVRGGRLPGSCHRCLKRASGSEYRSRGYLPLESCVAPGPGMWPPLLTSARVPASTSWQQERCVCARTRAHVQAQAGGEDPGGPRGKGAVRLQEGGAPGGWAPTRASLHCPRCLCAPAPGRKSAPHSRTPSWRAEGLPEVTGQRAQSWNRVAPAGGGGFRFYSGPRWAGAWEPPQGLRFSWASGGSPGGGAQPRLN